MIKKISILCFCFLIVSVLSAQESIRVMTWNLRTGGISGQIDRETGNSWQERLPRIRTLWKELSPDLVGTQELYRYQVRDLEKMSGFRSFGIGRNGYLEGDESCAVLYNPERFELEQNGTFSLNETPEVYQKGWDAAYLRIVTWGIFKDRRSGQSFILYNVHLDNKGDTARLEGTSLILRHYAKSGRALPMILTGDFNARPNSSVIVKIRHLLYDTRQQSQSPPEGPQDYSYTGYRTETKIPRLGPIDYIFVSQEWKVLTHRTVNRKPDGKFPSDHCPLVVELQLDLSTEGTK